MLVALDARDMTEITRADLPQVCGMGPHGTYIEAGRNELPSDA